MNLQGIGRQDKRLDLCLIKFEQENGKNSTYESAAFACFSNYGVRHFLKSKTNFFSTLFMWRPEPQRVRAGKGTFVTSLVVFFRIVTTSQKTSMSVFWYFGGFVSFLGPQGPLVLPLVDT